MSRHRTVLPLRAPQLAALGCATLVTLAATPARAFFCELPPWEAEGLPGSVRNAKDVPVDVVLWELVRCSELALPSGCRLEAGGASIPVDIEVTGEDTCDIAYEDLEDENYPDVIIHYAPAQTLSPGVTYTLECEANGPLTRGGLDLIEVQVRDSDAPASPPESLAGAKVELKRGDDSCCDAAAWIEVTVDFEAPYLREGGYIEATYANGLVMAQSRPEIFPTMRFPATRKPLRADAGRGRRHPRRDDPPGPRGHRPRAALHGLHGQ